MLVQTPDVIDEDPSTWETVTDRRPSEDELRDLAFAWKAVKHIKSNAIVFAKERSLVGMGAGQPNRVVSVHLSGRAAGLDPRRLARNLNTVLRQVADYGKIKRHRRHGQFDFDHSSTQQARRRKHLIFGAI